MNLKLGLSGPIHNNTVAFKCECKSQGHIVGLGLGYNRGCMHMVVLESWGLGFARVCVDGMVLSCCTAMTSKQCDSPFPPLPLVTHGKHLQVFLQFFALL